VIGPLLGGWLTENVSWHWIFYVNLPIGAVAMYIIYRLLPTVRGDGSHRELDFLGAGVFTAAISLLLVGLTYKGVVDPSIATGGTYDWATLPVGGLIAASILVGLLFLFVESRAKSPIVPLDLFRNRTYSVSILATFLASFGFFGALVFLPRWFQFVKGVSPTESGLQSLALLAGLIFSSIVSGIVISRTKHGFVCANAGVDASNTGAKDIVTLLPDDPDRSARRIRDLLPTLMEIPAEMAPAVIVSDSFGRPWRFGIVDVALGVAGIPPLVDLRDTPDVDGRVMHSTIVALADEICSAAELAAGKTSRQPVVLVRGIDVSGDGSVTRDVVMPTEMDLFK
jgi:hypothetical protein